MYYFNYKFSWGSPDVSGLAFIPYSFYIIVFLNSRLRNYDPQSFMFSVGQVYLVNHIFSTKFVTVINFLSSHCVILNHLVMGSIIETALSIKGSF